VRVVHVSFSSRGGAGIAATRIADAQRSHGIDSQALFQTHGTASTIALRAPVQFAQASGDFFLVRRNLKNPLFTLLRGGGSLDSEPLLSQADILHLHWIPGAVSLQFIENRLDGGGRVAFTMHDMWPFTGGCHHRLTCENLSQDCSGCPQARTRFAESVIAAATRKRELLTHPLMAVSAPSEWLAAELRAAVPELSKASVIPNPVNTELFHPVPASKTAGEFVLAICAADLSVPTKQVVDFTRQLEESRSEFGKPIRLLAIGRRLPRELSALNWVTHVEPGSERQLARLLATSDVLVSPSLVESFGYTVAEAGSCGTPAVVLGGSAVGELVAPSQSGEIVTSLKQMVEVLVHLSHHPEDIQDMGDAAREIAEQHFGFARVAEKFASLYDV